MHGLNTVAHTSIVSEQLKPRLHAVGCPLLVWEEIIEVYTWLTSVFSSPITWEVEQMVAFQRSSRIFASIEEDHIL